jgi:uncharacterized protein
MSEPRIPLEGAREKPLQFFGETTLSVESLGGDPLVSISPVQMRGTITAIDSEYLLDAEVAFSGELTCSRCVSPYAFSESVPVHLRLRKRPGPPPRAEKPRPVAVVEEEREMDPGELDVVLLDQPVLPFEDIAREQVLMAIPMKPLCRDDCRGLCPNCGADWNAGDCLCEKNTLDPRLEVLKSLK